MDAFDRAESARAAFEEKRDALEKADRAKQEIEEFKGQIAALKADWMIWTDWMKSSLNSAPSMQGEKPDRVR